MLTMCIQQKLKVTNGYQKYFNLTQNVGNNYCRKVNKTRLGVSKLMAAVIGLKYEIHNCYG